MLSSSADIRIDSLSPFVFSQGIFLFMGALPPLGLKELKTSVGKVFNRVIFSDLFFNDSDAPTLAVAAVGSCDSRFSPDTSFPCSLSLFCSLELLQDLGSDHLPILLAILFPPLSNIDSNSAEEYSSLAFCSNAVLLSLPFFLASSNANLKPGGFLK